MTRAEEQDMTFQTERDIQDYIETRLKQRGIPVEREVVCGKSDVRADLVTPDTVIEVKKYLNRNAIYQAIGQGSTYQKYLNKPKLLVIGLAPISLSAYQQAERLAADVQTPRLQVVFIDRDPRWGVQPVQLPAPPQPTRAKPSPPQKTSPQVDWFLLLLAFLLFLLLRMLGIGTRLPAPLPAPVPPRPDAVEPPS
ncbi:MAG: hypothetical protein IGS50_07305 [Synechococcales cyanobacterium C42_A2020_086]|jgi:hypothetical protein|nr:hypothetical protein [Synechococcales cyanobacterium C42_A2020_086]